MIEICPKCNSLITEENKRIGFRCEKCSKEWQEQYLKKHEGD